MVSLPLSPLNYYVQASKTQNQNIRLNMGLMSSEGGLNKIRHIDVDLFVRKVF